MCFRCCCLDSIFARFSWIWASKEGPCWGPFSMILQFLHKEKRAEIEARKLKTFGRLLGGAGGSGEAYRTMQILQIMVRKSSHALLSLRGCGELLMGYALCRRPVTIAHCSRVADSWRCCKRILAFFGIQTCCLACLETLRNTRKDTLRSRLGFFFDFWLT